MQRLILLVAVLALLVEVYAIVSCILMPADRVRTLPKWAWLLVVVLVPVVGAVAWIVIGRERATYTAPTRGPAPDDLAGPVRTGRYADQDERIAQLEAELARLDAEGDQDGEPRPRG